MPSGGGNLAGVGTANVAGFNISHFGVGSGGSSIVAGVPQIITPTVSDVELASPLQINSPALNYVSPVSTQVNAAKPITTDGSITFQTDVSSNNHRSTVLCNCVVAASEPITDETGAALTTGKAKYIEFEATLTIEWYVIF